MDIRVGDCRELLREMPPGSVRCCVTSPPYWGLRDYGHAGQLGLERTPEEYVAHMVEVFRDVKRVLADDGTLWLNLGDSYNNRNATRKSSHQTGLGFDSADLRKSWVDLKAEGRTRMSIENGDLKEKDLVGIPWMIAFALRADGWYLRSDIIWAKPNPMPESVTDRPTKAHEYLFLLAKSQRYYYDAAAIAEPGLTLRERIRPNGIGNDENKAAPLGFDNSCGADGTRNRRTVWTIPTRPFAEAHFAVMPEALVEPCILAGSAPGDTVLDPFAGSGTVGVVALRYGRRFLGCELNAEYVTMARRRVAGPLFSGGDE